MDEAFWVTIASKVLHQILWADQISVKQLDCCIVLMEVGSEDEAQTKSIVVSEFEDGMDHN